MVKIIMYRRKEMKNKSINNLRERIWVLEGFLVIFYRRLIRKEQRLIRNMHSSICSIMY